MSRESYCLLAVACIVVVFCACSKSRDAVGNKPVNDTLLFSVSGFKNRVMLQTDTLLIPVSVNYVSGTPKAVSLALSAYPPGINLSIIPQIDTPDYDSEIKLIAHNVVAGTYPITLTATSNEIVRTYTMVLTVDTIPLNPALALVSNYIETGTCSATGNKNNNVSVTIYNGNSNYNEVLLENIWTTNGTMDAVAIIDPAAKTLSIPGQQVGPLTISGAGMYTNNTISIDYTVTDGNIVNDNCTTVLTRNP